MRLFFGGKVFRMIAEALNRGEWWAIAFVLFGSAILLLAAAYPLFLIKFR